MKKTLSFVLFFITWASPAFCLVEGLEIQAVDPVAEGRSFGLAGPYEKVTGRLTISLDPDSENVIDLDRAPRDEDGRVRFQADLYLLRPVHTERGRGTLFLEVPNRAARPSSGISTGMRPAALTRYLPKLWVMGSLWSRVTRWHG